jgi:hypothetical protein
MLHLFTKSDASVTLSAISGLVVRVFRRYQVLLLSTQQMNQSYVAGFYLNISRNFGVASFCF